MINVQWLLGYIELLRYYNIDTGKASKIASIVSAILIYFSKSASNKNVAKFDSKFESKEIAFKSWS